MRGSARRLALNNIKLVLDKEGITWCNMVKVTKYLTDMREADATHGVFREYMGDWLPASTMICINNLSSPGTRFELDMIPLSRPRSGHATEGRRTTDHRGMS